MIRKLANTVYAALGAPRKNQKKQSMNHAASRTNGPARLLLRAGQPGEAPQPAVTAVSGTPRQRAGSIPGLPPVPVLGLLLCARCPASPLSPLPGHFGNGLKASSSGPGGFKGGGSFYSFGCPGCIQPLAAQLFPLRPTVRSASYERT